MHENEYIKPPLCGIDPDDAFHPAQCKSAASFSKEKKKDLARELKCACVGAENTIGSYKRSLPIIHQGQEIPSPAEANLKHIASIVKHEETQYEKECAWMAFSDPIWPDIMRLLQHEDSGIEIDLNTIPNIVYEGFLFYKSCFDQIDAHIINKRIEEREKREQQRQSEARARVIG